MRSTDWQVLVGVAGFTFLNTWMSGPFWGMATAFAAMAGFLHRRRSHE